MKLRSSEKRTFGPIAALAYISGALIFIYAKWIRVSSSIGPEHHPLEHWFRISHTVTTYFIVLVMGYLVRSHILPGLRSKSKKRIWSGIGNILIFSILIMTAIFLLYGSDGQWTNAMSLIHIIVGLGCPLFIIIHAARRKGKSKESRF